MWTETRFLQERTGSDKGFGHDDFKVRHIPDRGPCDVMWDHKTEGAIVSDPQLDTTDVKKSGWNMPGRVSVTEKPGPYLNNKWATVRCT